MDYKIKLNNEYLCKDYFAINNVRTRHLAPGVFNYFNSDRKMASSLDKDWLS